MPVLEEDDLNDLAVMLETVAIDRHGRVKVNSAPVEITCRWVDHEETQGKGEQDTSSIVATVYVDRAIRRGSILWRGALADFPKDWAAEASKLLRVEGVYSLDDVDGHETRRWVTCVRSFDALPAQV